MLGLLLIYFIGKNYMNLAVEHNKTKWLFAILGVVAYYVGMFLGGLILGLIIHLTQPLWLESTSDFIWSLFCLPFGVGATVGLYFILKKSWTKNHVVQTEILDQL